MTVELIKELIEIHSPSGYTEEVIKYIHGQIKHLPYKISFSNKGALLVSTVEKPELVLTAHIDTLGGMVKFIKSDGSLEITQIGGWPPNSFEGEHLTILTQSEKKYRGTFLINNPAAHVNRNVSKAERKMEEMHIRIDAKTKSKEDTEKLGISIGDFVFFDPRFELTETGFIKSRFMDDKACAGVLYDIIQNHFDDIKNKSVAFFFSNYEEVGHGGCAGIPQSVKEMLVADMGVVGDNAEGLETAVSICAKDSSGPYDYKMRQKLVSIARENDIPFVVDVFPYYGSDGSAALSSGLDVRVGLIGPGVSSSHGVERTHEEGVRATKNLILGYIDAS